MKNYIVFKGDVVDSSGEVLFKAGEDYFIIDENMDSYFAQTEDGSKKMYEFDKSKENIVYMLK